MKKAYVAADSQHLPDSEDALVHIPGLIPLDESGMFRLSGVRLAPVYSKAAAEALLLNLDDPDDARILQRICDLRTQLILCRLLSERMTVHDRFHWSGSQSD